MRAVDYCGCVTVRKYGFTILYPGVEPRRGRARVYTTRN